MTEPSQYLVKMLQGTNHQQEASEWFFKTGLELLAEIKKTAETKGRGAELEKANEEYIGFYKFVEESLTQWEIINLNKRYEQIKQSWLNKAG